MDTHEKMAKYIAKTGIDGKTRDRYDLKGKELNALGMVSDSDLFGAINPAFSYGLAKGYRAARAEGKR